MTGLTTRLGGSIKRVLLHPFLPIWLALLAVIVMLPSLWLGYMLDDFIHRAWLLERSQLDERLLDTGGIPSDSGTLVWSLANLFAWTGPQYDMHPIVESGLVPWWASHDTVQSFYRPLTAFTHWIDYRLWPESPPLMHAQSCVWFVVAIISVTLLYRKYIGTPCIAGFAAFLYTLDESFYLPVAWLANRNVVISLFFGACALIAHRRWRQERAGVWCGVSILSFLCALLATEAGIATLAYIVAYAVFLDRESLLRRLLGMAPTLVVGGVWRFSLVSWGYGMKSSGLYIDPLAEFSRYAGNALACIPVLLLGQFGWPPAVLHAYLSPAGQGIMWLGALIYVGIVCVLMIPLIRRDPLARFWALGMVLCLVPACCVTLPDDRLLFFVGIGAMGLTAQFCGGLMAKDQWAPSNRWWRVPAWALCTVFLLVQVVGASAARFTRPYEVMFFKKSFESTLPSFSAHEISSQRLIIMNAPSPFALTYLPFIRAQEAAPIPCATRILAPGFVSLEIERTGRNVLVVQSVGTSLLAMSQSDQSPLFHPAYRDWRFCGILRPQGLPMRLGERTLLSDVKIEILDIGEDGLPNRVAFTFKVPLDDPSLRWLMWDWKKMCYEPFRVPALGDTVRIGGPF